MNLPYDKNNPLSIEKYAKKLEGKKFFEGLKDYYSNSEIRERGIGYSEKNELQEKIAYFNNPRGKGSLGNLLEEYYFYYKPNSDSNPDFLEAGTELKVTPIEKKRDGSLRAGERLVITMIPNDRPVEPVFGKSHVLEKMRLMLLILYLREKDILRTVYLAKADLVSNVISEKEFTKLQGFMGSIYAKYEGEKENVSKGIFEHYLPRYQGDILPETIEGAIASISDKLDTVMGCFAVGLIPTSSKDPYALRRATQGIVLTAINSGLNFDYIKLINRAYEIFSEDKKVLNKDAVKNVVDFFKSRLEAQLQTRFSKNLISYQINKESKIIDLVSKIEYLEKLSKTEDFEILINLIKRLKNISKNINKEVNVDLFNKKEEKDLFEITSKLKGNIEDVNILLENKNVINNFFENVIINDEDESIRNNRLALIDKMVNKLDLILDVK